MYKILRAHALRILDANHHFLFVEYTFKTTPIKNATVPGPRARQNEPRNAVEQYALLRGGNQYPTN